MCQWTRSVLIFGWWGVLFWHVTPGCFRKRIVSSIIFSTFSLALISTWGRGMLKREMGTTVFCAENFANLKRHNTLPSRSSSSLSEFPFICYFISCRQTFTCISAPPLNVTAVFVHLQIIVWVITKDSAYLFSGWAVALEFSWGLYCALLMVCYNSNTKNDLVQIAHLITFISFLYSNKYKSHGC